MPTYQKNGNQNSFSTLNAHFFGSPHLNSAHGACTLATLPPGNLKPIFHENEKELDRQCRCDRSGRIPHGFHTKRPFRTAHPAAPRSTHQRTNAHEIEESSTVGRSPCRSAIWVLRDRLCVFLRIHRVFLRLLIWLETQVFAPLNAVLRGIRVESDRILSRIGRV